jgi:hypothetical protein
LLIAEHVVLAAYEQADAPSRERAAAAAAGLRPSQDRVYKARVEICLLRRSEELGNPKDVLVLAWIVGAEHASTVACDRFEEDEDAAGSCRGSYCTSPGVTISAIVVDPRKNRQARQRHVGERCIERSGDGVSPSAAQTAAEGNCGDPNLRSRPRVGRETPARGVACPYRPARR